MRITKKIRLSAINIIVQVSRLQDGSRKVVSVSEISGMEGNVITMQEIFKFEQLGIENSKVIGKHISTGIRPTFIEKLQERGITFNSEYFVKDRNHTYSNIFASQSLNINKMSSIKNDSNSLVNRLKR